MGLDGSEFVDDGVDDAPVATQEKPGAGLRKQLETALAEIAELKKARDAATEKATRFELDTVFTKLGVPEKVRTLYVGEPTEDAVTKWVTDYKDVFGLELTTETVEETDADAADLKSVQGAASVGQGRSVNVPLKRLDDLLASKGPRNSDDLVRALLEEGFAHGGVEVPRELM